MYIFISYSRKDIAFAQKLVDALAANSLDTWIDWKSIPKGEDWEQEIYRGIEGADAFLFLISPDSVVSDMCNKEIAHAVNNGKRILPIVLRNAKTEEFLEEVAKKEISKRNWIFCRDGQEDFNQAIEETRHTICTDYEWLRYHTDLQVKALHWERKQDSSRLLRGKELYEAEVQLARVGNQKDPPPTDLQRNYLLSSQRHEVRQRRQITMGLGLGLVLVSLLALFAWEQRTKAVNSAATAIAEEHAKSAALVNERNAHATAQAEKNRAERQAQISLARQLSMQAQTITIQSTSSELLGVQLAIQSMRLFPSAQASEVLLSNKLATRHRRFSTDGSIESVVFSPDGKYLATGGLDHTARVWDVATGEEVSRVTHGDDVLTISISPDGRFLASGGDDATILITDIFSGQKFAQLPHRDFVRSLNFSADSSLIASCSGDTIYVWDAKTGRKLAELEQAEQIYSVEFSRDGRYLLSRGERIASTWDVSDFHQIAFHEHSYDVFTVTFAPNEQYVASGGNDELVIWETTTGKVKERISHEGGNDEVLFSSDGEHLFIRSLPEDFIIVWNLVTGEEVWRLQQNDWITSIDMSPDHHYLATGSLDQTVRVWDLETGNEVLHVICDGDVSLVRFSPTGDYLLSTSYPDQAVELWKLETEQTTFAPYHAEDEILSLSLSPEGDFLAVGGRDQTTRVLSTKSWKEVTHLVQESPVFSTMLRWAQQSTNSDRQLQLLTVTSDIVTLWDAVQGVELYHIQHQDSVNDVAFSPDGERLVTAGYDKTTCVWQADTGKKILCTRANGMMNSVTFSPDGEYIIAGGDDNKVRMWDASKGTLISDVIHGASVLSIDLSPVAANTGIWYVASGSADQRARVWDIKTGQQLAEVEGNLGTYFYDVLFSPDGKSMVAGSDDGTLYLLDMATKKVKAIMKQVGGITSLAFSKDGKYLVSGGIESANLWDVTTGIEIAQMHHDGFVNSVVFTPDGKYVVSGGTDGVLKAWIYRPEDLIDNACKRISRNLTLAEWQQYVGPDIPYQIICDPAMYPNAVVPEDVQALFSSDS